MKNIKTDDYLQRLKTIVESMVRDELLYIEIDESITNSIYANLNDRLQDIVDYESEITRGEIFVEMYNDRVYLDDLQIDNIKITKDFKKIDDNKISENINISADLILTAIIDNKEFQLISDSLEINTSIDVVKQTRL